MDWITNFWKKPEEQEVDEISLPKTTIDIMREDVDPNAITIENAYKTRWIWYHTILAIGIFMTNILLIAIMLILAIKL